MIPLNKNLCLKITPWQKLVAIRSPELCSLFYKHKSHLMKDSFMKKYNF